MVHPDPYQHWYGAPKHWGEIPAQRQSPPAVLAVRSGPQRRSSPCLVALAVAALLLALTPARPSVADLDGPVRPAAAARP